LELLARLGLADRLHALPHGKIRDLRLRTKTRTLTLGDLGRLRTPYPYVMMLPQAKLLELLTDEAGRFPHFRLVMRANVQRLVEAAGAGRGGRSRRPANPRHAGPPGLTLGAGGP